MISEYVWSTLIMCGLGQSIVKGKGRKRSASENWLEHALSSTLENGGILQPQMKKKCTVSTPVNFCGWFPSLTNLIQTLCFMSIGTMVIKLREFKVDKMGTLHVLSSTESPNSGFTFKFVFGRMQKPWHPYIQHVTLCDLWWAWKIISAMGNLGKCML